MFTISYKFKKYIVTLENSIEEKKIKKYLVGN